MASPAWSANRRTIAIVVGSGSSTVDLPRDDEDELGPSADCDRRAERRADPELANALQACPSRASARTSGTKETPRSSTAPCEAREVPQRHPQPWRPLVTRRIAAHELELAVIDPPEHAVVGAERRSRLTADRRRHLVGRVGVEARRDLQDAVERRPGLALAIVETGALERLLGEDRDGRCDRGELVVDRVLAVEQELDHAVRATARHAAARRRPTGPRAGGSPRCPETRARASSRSFARTSLSSRMAAVRTVRAAERDAPARARGGSQRGRWARRRARRRSRAARAPRPARRTASPPAPPARARPRRRRRRRRDPRSTSAGLRRAPESSRPRARPRSRAAARDAVRPRTRRSGSPRRG